MSRSSANELGPQASAVAELTGTPASGQPAPSPEYHLGVLFVHGIGTQVVGTTLADFGTPLFEWLQSAASNAGETVALGKVTLVPHGDDPASSEINLTTKGELRRWLLAESWWAQSFEMARFRDVAEWGLLILPWTIGTHFARRLALLHQQKRTLSKINAVAVLIAALLLSPGALVALAILLVLGRIPWPPLHNALAKIQLTLASTIGDSYLLVSRPLEAAAIRSRLRRDLEWLESKCRTVAVIAHSQGAAIACQVLSRWTSRKHPHERLLITFGSGLRKLEEIDDARKQGRVLQGAMLTVAGLLVTGLTVAAAPQVVADVYHDAASPASLVTLLVFGTIGAAIGIAGIQDFVHSTEPVRVRIISAYLALNGILQWEDLFASADPVPGGPLRADGGTPPTSTEVVNLGSVFRDHTSYWRNRDEFVSIVGEKLLRIDGTALLPPDYPEVLRFLRAQRRIRVGVLRSLHWATAACVVALVMHYRSDWLAVAAWASQRALGWATDAVGYVTPVQAMPDLMVWRRSAGWLAAVAVSSWVTRAMWNVWNNAAMDDARRDDLRVREPFAVSLALFVQLLVAGVALSSPGVAVGIAMGGVLALAVVTTVAQGLHRPPRTATSTDSPRLPGAFLVAHALLKLLVVPLTIVAASLAFIDGARRVQEFLAGRLGVVASWIAASVLIVVGVAAAVTAVRAMIKFFSARRGAGGSKPGEPLTQPGGAQQAVPTAERHSEQEPV